ncbi:hypothetical protein BKA67DRAFT_8506 [Truncatella angustata]|uniref:Heterokaryon incompatibility domain-containing protein n=1 Tax=Truncatella angustata TaxID=152316 RepID=A0A9P8UVS3_9PEZI|nr:uncharacterized protein BKA67DRAFT_8506 [Truncatella angustata]KAH6659230.1 hypothetical protein BKA67DRAFT_8506 [Truncatella angustata]
MHGWDELVRTSIEYSVSEFWSIWGPPSDNRGHSWIQALNLSPWWSRVWVVQEIALAKKIPVILAGTRMTQLSHLIGVEYWFRHHDMLEMNCSLTAMYHFLWSKFRAGRYDGLSNAERLSSIFRSIGLRDAFLSQDFICGLLGLAFRGLIPDHLQINYAKDFEVIYRDVADLRGTYYVSIMNENA